jgi:hypothetical protein
MRRTLASRAASFSTLNMLAIVPPLAPPRIFVTKSFTSRHGAP